MHGRKIPMFPVRCHSIHVCQIQEELADVNDVYSFLGGFLFFLALPSPVSSALSWDLAEMLLCCPFVDVVPHLSPFLLFPTRFLSATLRNPCPPLILLLMALSFHGLLSRVRAPSFPSGLGTYLSWVNAVSCWPPLGSTVPCRPFSQQIMTDYYFACHCRVLLSLITRRVESGYSFDRRGCVYVLVTRSCPRSTPREATGSRFLGYGATSRPSACPCRIFRSSLPSLA